MGIRLRQSDKLVPGVRINLGIAGVSTSIGPGDTQVSMNPRANRGDSTLSALDASRPVFVGQRDLTLASKRQLRGASPRLMKALASRPSPGASRGDDQSPLPLSTPELLQLADFVSQVHARRQHLAGAIQERERLIAFARKTLERSRPLPFRIITYHRRPIIAERAALLERQCRSLRAQLDATQIVADTALSPSSDSAFLALNQWFQNLRVTDQIWDVRESAGLNSAAPPALSSDDMTRYPVPFTAGTLDVMDCGHGALHMTNADGDDLYLLPCFVALRRHDETFSLIDIRDIKIDATSLRVIEHERVPTDSEVDRTGRGTSTPLGSLDRLSSGPHAVPVLRYGQLSVTSCTGLNEVFMISNARICEAFAKAFAKYVATLPPRGGVAAMDAVDMTNMLPELALPVLPRVPRLMDPTAWAVVASAVLLGVAAALTLWPVTATDKAPTQPGREADRSPTSETGQATLSAQSIRPAAPNGSPEKAAQRPLSRAEISVIQEKLRALGYDVATVDGVAGPRTQAAARAYQARAGLPDTGVDRTLFDRVARQATR
jgi:Putative peptidoglycan binding domain/Protein of unknown function (DUF4236)